MSPDVCISFLESGGLLCFPFSKILGLGVVYRSWKESYRSSGLTFLSAFPPLSLLTLERGSKLCKFTDCISGRIKTRIPSLLPSAQ